MKVPNVCALTASHYDVCRLLGVLSASPDPIFIKDVDHRYHLVNQAFLETCGLTAAEGKMDTELFSPEMVATVRANDERVLQQGIIIRVEEVIELQGKWRTFYVIKFPLFGGNRGIVGMGGIATDITERRRAEQDNARLTIHARAVQEAAAHKATFLAMASHELRTPLGGIVGLADLMRRQPLEAEGRRLLELMDDSARGLLRIVNDLLDLSKIEAGKMDFVDHPFCLREQLSALLATLSVSATEQRVSLTSEIDQEVPEWWQGDVLRLKQVLINLLGNAIKFSPGGRVQLRVRAERPHDEPGPSSTDLHLEVADSGQGIAANELQHIFTPFYQAGRGPGAAGRGTGLGLPICQSIISAMGGEISVESTLGAGTTFRCRLPLVACEAPTEDVAPAGEVAGGEDDRAHGRILVVEDDRVNQTVICALLRQLGVRHILAEDGEAAVAHFESSHFDVVLMDCMLRGIDGCEATRRIFEAARGRSRPSPRVVALTAGNGSEERQRCERAGMVDFLVKPVGLSELRDTLRKHNI